MLLVPVILLSIIGTSLLVHHGCKHAADDPATSTAQRESCAVVCYFQLKDITHFETWILVCLTNAVSLTASGGPSVSSPIALASLILFTVATFLTLMLVITVVVLYVAGERHCERREHLLPTISKDATVNKSNEKLNWLHTLLHNVSNHETWILVCFTNAVSLAVV